MALTNGSNGIQMIPIKTTLTLSTTPHKRHMKNGGANTMDNERMNAIKEIQDKVYDLKCKVIKSFEVLELDLWQMERDEQKSLNRRLNESYHQEVI
jgi:hypothetical protein